MTEDARPDHDAARSDVLTDTPVGRRRALQVGATAIGAIALASVSAAPAQAAPATQGPVGRREQSFDEGWSFHRGDVSGAHRTGYDDSGWRRLDLPHDWSIEDLPYATSTDGAATADPSTMAFQTSPPAASVPTVIGPFDPAASTGGTSTGWTVGGIGWYRKHFSLPATTIREHGARIELRFDGGYHQAEIWVNGVDLGSHTYGYTPVVVDLTPHLATGGANVVAVKVSNTTKETRWYAGSGIYRHTWLTLTGSVHVPTDGVFVTTPTVTAEHSTAHVVVDAANSGTARQSVRARVTLLDPAGRRVAVVTGAPLSVAPGRTGELTVDVPVPATQLWSLQSPHLYTARTDLLVGAVVFDTVTTTFGFRSLVWSGTRGLLINGEQVKVRGACLHSGYGPLGAVALGRSVERQVQVLKQAGFNAIRTAHNPSDPHLLDVCDALGMVVWDEAYDHWTVADFDATYRRDLTAFVRRDRNHPSVIIWSTGNEVNDPVRGKVLHDFVKTLDATRPVTQGATPFEYAADPQYAYVDVTDVHYDIADKAAIRAAYPNRAMTQSESWPATIYDDWHYALDNDHVVGSWVWVGWDYLGEAGTGATITSATGEDLPVFGHGPYPWFLDYQGDIDFIGQRKPQNFWRAAVYGTSPVEVFVERPAPAGVRQYANNWSYYDELASWTWDVPTGQLMTVHVYTGGDRVRLLLNGRTVATRSLTSADKCVAAFEVAYTPGSLVAVTSKGGRETGRKTLTTVGAPAALRLSSDVPTMTTGRDDLAHVLVEVVDSAGRVVPDATVEVEFDVLGAGELVGVGSGNPHNIDSFQRPSHFTWHGQVLAIVRPAKKAGAVTLVATAHGVRPAHLTIPVG